MRPNACFRRLPHTTLWSPLIPNTRGGDFVVNLGQLLPEAEHSGSGSRCGGFSVLGQAILPASRFSGGWTGWKAGPRAG